MNRFKYLFLVLFAGLLITCSYLYGLHVKSQIKETKDETVIVNKPSAEPTIDEPVIESRLVQPIGNSMYPTLKDGKTYTEYRINPKVDDIIDFVCSKPECYQGKSGSNHFVKRLIKIREDGAFWVLGDNREHSYDSSEYGWILPSEISDIWVIKLK